MILFYFTGANAKKIIIYEAYIKTHEQHSSSGLTLTIIWNRNAVAKKVGLSPPLLPTGKSLNHDSPS